jgi:DHA1 family tetracycline resistance protein-like MFS transporter
MASPKPLRAPALTFILITVTLDMLAFGIIAPVLPSLVKNFVGGDAAEASQVLGIFGTLFALMQFVFAPILGILSDRFGRRPVIVLSTLGLGLDFIVMAAAPTLGWLYVGRIISGITAASVATASAYIADVTPPEKRAGAFGVIGAAFGIGFILGPLLGGFLGDVNARLPFWVAAGFALANALYGFFVLPESLPVDKRSTQLAWRRANPLGSLTLFRSHRALLGMTGVNFLAYVAHEVFNIWVLYTIYRYAWNQKMNGVSLAIVGVASVVISGFGVARIVKALGERRTLALGLAAGAAGFAIFGLAPAGWIFLAGIPVLMLWNLATPAAQGIMSRHVSSSEQGELQGALSSLRGVAMMVGPGLFTWTFSMAIGAHADLHLPGAPWFLAAVMLLAAVCIAWIVTRGDDSHTPIAEAETEPALIPTA